MAAATGLTPLSAEHAAKLVECFAIHDADVSPAAASDTAWRSEGEPAPGVTASSRGMPGTSLRKFKAVGMIPGPPEQVAYYLWDPAGRTSWDTTCAAWTRLSADCLPGGSPAGTIDDIGVHHLCVRRVLVVSPRDFVSVQCKRLLADGTLASVAFAVEDARAPATADYVRAEVWPGSAWRVEPVRSEDGQLHSRLYYIMFSDVKGWLPHAAINSAMTATIKEYYTLLRGLAYTQTAQQPEVAAAQ
jgi:DNA-directed RNA polymerase subunit N (RpoN/RPB10)